MNWIDPATWRLDEPWGVPNLPSRFSVSREPTPFPWDLDGSGDVGVRDFLQFISN